MDSFEIDDTILLPTIIHIKAHAFNVKFDERLLWVDLHVGFNVLFSFDVVIDMRSLL